MALTSSAPPETQDPPEKSPEQDKKTVKAASRKLPPGLEIAIIYNPKSAKTLGDFGLFHRVNHGGRKIANGNDEEVSLALVIFKRGANFIPHETWTLLEAHNPDKIAELKGMQALRVHIPDAENPVGSTADYTDMMVVREIVSSCPPTQEDWLRRSSNRDTRPEAYKTINKQLDQFRDDKNQRGRGEGGFDLI